MTPSARISAAIALLDQVFAGAPAEQALTRWARGARYAGSKDRAAVRDHVFQALRCRRSYGAFGGGSDGRAVMIGAVRAQGGMPEHVFTGEGHAPAPLSETEAAQIDARLTEAEAADLPDWLWQVFVEDLGEDAGTAAQAQRARAPIALRANLKMNNAQQAIEKLLEEGIEAELSGICSTALIVTSGERKIRQSRAFLDGYVELQDASSQAAMARVKLDASARILDYCAGGGGKVLALASGAAPDRDARFYAHDADAGRMVDLPTRAARAGVEVTCLETRELPSQAPFDLVLCDVPCSGSGTWRRSPEAKWRLTPDRLQSLLKIQQDILQSACNLVRPGGQLIYSTCSVLARENEAQIARFCAAHSDLTVQDEIRWPVTDQGDGFYLAAMRRSG